MNLSLLRVEVKFIKDNLIR